MMGYVYRIATDVLDQPISIEFELLHDYKEFLKQLLQILGMYNFLVKDQQNIWQNGEAYIEINAPNGTIILKINQQKNISILANSNSKDLLKIDALLSRFYIFRKEEIQRIKSA